MIKTDKKGNIVACLTTKEDLDYSNFDKETIDYYEGFLIPSYEELSDKQNKEIERLHNIIKEVREKVNIIQFEIKSNTKNYNNLYIDLKSTLQGQELLEILDKEN